MTNHKHPAEIAREVFRLLAARKLLPTPGNYQDLYNEVADLPSASIFPESKLRKIALAIQAKNEAQQTQLDQLDRAIGRHSWQGIEEALVALVQADLPVPVPDGEDATEAPPARPAIAAESVQKLLAEIADLIENIQRAFGRDDDHFSHQVAALLNILRAPDMDLQRVQSQLDFFSKNLTYVAEEQTEIKLTLLKLLHLIIDNISKLSLHDSWFDGQIKALLQATRPPLDLRRLDDVESRIRNVMLKQAAAKARAMDAQEEMRQMLGSFIEQLSEINDSSMSYQGKIEASARLIESITAIEELAPILKDVIEATHEMASSTAQSRAQLEVMQEKVRATEEEITKLHLELDSASALARHDPLTNVLNRKGLDEALTREIANMHRKGTDLSIALLDVDDFKKINDRLGHDTGDEALIHLVKVVQEDLRPFDTLARYGGEEFVILMPETNLEKAAGVMVRLQRQLTKKFFLSGNEKVLITFSAGVAQLQANETYSEAIKRADQAMYLAKRSGKNRVMTN